MKKLVIMLFVFILFHTPIQPAGGTEHWLIGSQDAEVLYDDPLEEDARRVLEIYPAIRSEIEERLGWHLDIRPRIVLVGARDRFQRIVSHELFVAVAIPEQDLIIIDHSRMNLSPFSLPVTLKHEMCHLLLHRHIKEENLPRWFDEGVAQWMSDGISEVIIRNGPAVLGRAGAAGNWIPLRRLHHGFPRNDPALSLAYEESKNVVEYMVEVGGAGSIPEILEYLSAGISIDDAVERVLGLSFDEMENDWHRHLKKQIPWLLFLSSHLYEILFFIGALLLVTAFLRLWWRKRTYRDEEDDEELFYRH
ncbi:MAG: hypothetical protein JXO48_07495 [Deltaproteobacteria bacterium]|nr:hypothetical protein [Deltaproteobacteria bacterium]